MKTIIKRLFNRKSFADVIGLIKTREPKHFPEIRQMMAAFESKKVAPSEDDLFLVHCGFLAALLNTPEFDIILSIIESELLFRNIAKKEYDSFSICDAIRKSLTRVYSPWRTDIATGKKNITNLRNLILDIYYVGKRDDGLRWELSFLSESVENLALSQYEDACKVHQELLAQKNSNTGPSQFRTLYQSNIGAMEEALTNLTFALRIAGHKSNKQYDFRHMRNYVQNLKIDQVNI